MNHNDPAWSYAAHRAHETNAKEALPSCYTSPDSIDAWRHERMYEHLLPLVKAYPGATWMTIGDGRYGCDAYFLAQHGADVLATSLSDQTLSIAHQRGYIEKFRADNAERLAAADDSHDFVLCKESYHHFPRQAIAFYEMLRVSRRAVILIEPQETSIKLLDHAKQVIKKVIRHDKTAVFEESGNFVYKVDIGEIEKMMTALNYQMIAVCRFNDFYHPRLSHRPFASRSLPTFITRLGIKVQNLLCRLKTMDYGLACVVAFKFAPAEDIARDLRRHGFRLRYLPKNPYLREA